jgi:hypothetical protein
VHVGAPSSERLDAETSASPIAVIRGTFVKMLWSVFGTGLRDLGMQTPVTGSGLGDGRLR